MDQVSGDKAELIARYNKLFAHYNWMVNEGFTIKIQSWSLSGASWPS